MTSSFRCLLLALTLASLSLSAPSRSAGASPEAAESVCVAKEPADVFECLEAAYESRDADALADLLSADYVFDFRLGGTTADRESELRMARSMFESEVTTAIRLFIAVTSDPEPGPEPGSWIFAGTSSRLEVDVDGQDGFRTHSVETGPTQTFYVRAVSGPRGYQIYRWEDLRTEP